ncbi:MAG TPA: acylphosphatase [Sphingomicrobium sp.]|nr:acylphosphatase [Sphingomicrobium sp.]
MDTCRIRARGLVQGVYFRAWTRDQARELGVSGWVRNCSDGSVEACVQGDPSKVQELVRRVHCGPPRALVDEVLIETVDSDPAQGFRIER